MKPTIQIIGETILNQPIELWSFVSSTDREILVLAGVHGDEYEGVELAQATLQYLSSVSEKLSANIRIIPVLNKDGYFLKTRSNFNDVDLNRNLPTANWSSEIKNPRYKPGPNSCSESETVALIAAISKFKPEVIISLHSFDKSLILYNSANGRFDSNVSSLSQRLKIPTVLKMDYEVSGSLNTYAKEHEIPTMTFEAPRGEAWPMVKDEYIKSFLDFIYQIAIC